MKNALFLLPLLAACGGPDAGPDSATTDHLFRVPPIQLQLLSLRFPIAHRDRGLMTAVPIVGMDHDPANSGGKTSCIDHNGFGFPFCYNDHDGTDFLLAGGFPQMDLHSPEVVAAADGVVEAADDGNYDRCEADAQTFSVTCHGNPMVANRVVLRHAGGYTTSYYHLKRGSVAVRVGQQVRCGQPLGRVGSSGISSMPHLHFSLHDRLGTLIDPYSGPRSQRASYWTLEVAPDGLPGDLCPGELRGIACGVVEVTNAAICGTRTVTNVFQCGVTTGESAAACGTTAVTDAARCGTQTITDAARCGSDWVTDAVACGTHTVNSLYDCLRAGFSGRSCNLANSCWKPRSCAVALSCSIPLSCEIPDTCEIPATCTTQACI